MFKYIATVCITFADKIGGSAHTVILGAHKQIPRNNFGSFLNESSEEYKNALALVKEQFLDTSKNMVIAIQIQEEFNIIDIVL